MSFEFKLSDANAKILNTAGKYLTDNINIMLDKAAVEGKIVEGQTILGVTGTAKKIKTQEKKEVAISAKSATITPDSGYYSMASLKYTVADAAYAINGGGLTGGSAVTPTVTLSLGNSDLTTSGNGATNIYSGTSGATLYDSEAAAKTAGYNYFLEINGASSAGSSTVSRDAMRVRASKAGWINSGDSATVNTASKTVTVNSGSKKKFVGIKTGSVKLNPVSISQGATKAEISAGTASNEISSKASVLDSAPSASEGYFVGLKLKSPSVSGKATGTTTAGWISSNPASANVTVSAGSGTAYVKIPAGSTTASASVTSSPAVTISGSTNMATANSGTYYFSISASKTNGKAKGSAAITEGYQPAGTKQSGEVAVPPTVSFTGNKDKYYIPSASTTLYSNTSNSTSGFKTTKTYENTQGYMPAGAKTAYTSTIDTVSGTGTITAVPSGATTNITNNAGTTSINTNAGTVNITSNAGTTNIAANTGTVNFVNWKLCNNAADACLDIYF